MGGNLTKKKCPKNLYKKKEKLAFKILKKIVSKRGSWNFNSDINETAFFNSSHISQEQGRRQTLFFNSPPHTQQSSSSNQVCFRSSSSISTSVLFIIILFICSSNSRLSSGLFSCFLIGQHTGLPVFIRQNNWTFPPAAVPPRTSLLHSLNCTIRYSQVYQSSSCTL